MSRIVFPDILDDKFSKIFSHTEKQAAWKRLVFWLGYATPQPSIGQAWAEGGRGG